MCAINSWNNKKKGERMGKGYLKRYNDFFQDTMIWVDSMVPENISYGIKQGLLGVTTSPTVTPDAIEAEPEIWKPAFRKKWEENPDWNQFEILWECMYDFAKERAKMLLPIYKDDKMDGRFCIQGNVYDFMNAEKIINQSKRIYSLGKNFIMKIPTTEAGLRAMEEIVYEGHSVMATATSSVAQVLAAGLALTKGLERREKEGKDNKGIVVSCAMQLGLPESCCKGYAKQNHVQITSEALEYSAIAVGKKAYSLLLEKYPRVVFVLSNFAKEEHWREFLGGRLIMTMPMDYLETLDNTDPQKLEAKIEIPVNEIYTEELCEKISFYNKMFREDGMKPEEFSGSEGFCRTVNLFMDIYETGLMAVRTVMLPNPYKDESRY
jgi:transaldolase